MALNASIFRFNWEEIQTLAGLVERTMDTSITISDNAAYVATELGEGEVSIQTLQEP